MRVTLWIKCLCQSLKCHIYKPEANTETTCWGVIFFYFFLSSFLFYFLESIMSIAFAEVHHFSCPHRGGKVMNETQLTMLRWRGSF